MDAYVKIGYFRDSELPEVRKLWRAIYSLRSIGRLTPYTLSTRDH